MPRLRRDGPKPAGERHCQLPDKGHDWSGSLHEDLNLLSEVAKRLVVMHIIVNSHGANCVWPSACVG